MNNRALKILPNGKYDYGGIEIEPENPEELFEVLSIIGKGNFGRVYKARNRNSGEIVAVKQMLAVEDEVESLRKEVEMLRLCGHENVVAYKGTYKTMNDLWIAMEYCAGGSVDSIYTVARRPLCEALIAYIMREVLKGLVYMHSHHMIHRDVKGGNILLTGNGGVKLADFGVSAQMMHTLSRRNSFIGTLYWMAPEAILEKEYDERADMWSLGITLIEIAEGMPPHMGALSGPAIFKIPREPPPTLRRPDVWSPLMRAFLARLVVKDPSQRPTAAMMLQDPFVTQHRIGTAEELAVVIREVAERAEGMTTARRLGEESSGSDGTFVAKASSTEGDTTKGTFDPRTQLDPFVREAIPEGMLVQLPLLNPEAFSLDELAWGGPLSSVTPLEAPVAEVLTTHTEEELAAAGIEVPRNLHHITRTLLASQQWYRGVASRKAVTAAEYADAQAKANQYNTLLSSVLGL